ncbi:MAG: UDP-N-acetylmuramate dehydrogenase [Chitinispirillia bacterium]|nr:UDP-N-acetylmuramate dehydrogenase [Chitinispirillia bacterium]MCL2242693.1 UDP-N-acetylmuramate dehydrogenase [Chitinispirillia bacterium]
MVTFLENVPLAGKTTYRIGGPARYYAEPQDEDEVAEAYRFAQDRKLPALILGNGSNMLISDMGFDGVVINLSAKLTMLAWNGTMAFASGGYPLDDFIAAAAERGYAGVEWLSGIPGTVGGAVVMNAGAFDAVISDKLNSVRVMRAGTLEIDTVYAQDIAFGYRRSAIQGTGDLVLSAIFELKDDDPARVTATRNDILNKRAEKQPSEPSCGSAFKRPPGNYAGTLIQASGLKGFKIGAVEVSEKHANFFTNTGGATAEDVRVVMRHVQKKVYEDSGVLLEPEVVFVGEFKEPLFTP